MVNVETPTDTSTVVTARKDENTDLPAMVDATLDRQGLSRALVGNQYASASAPWTEGRVGANTTVTIRPYKTARLGTA